MSTAEQSEKVVMAYIRALDGQEYDRALDCLDDNVRIRGPGGETFGKPFDFINMLRKYKGSYEVKKVFSKGDDVCVLYDLHTTGANVYMSSWYQVKDNKIVAVQTVFDPRAFGPPSEDK